MHYEPPFKRLLYLNRPWNCFFTCKNWILPLFFSQVKARQKAEVNRVLFSEFYPGTDFIFSTGSVQLVGLKINMSLRGSWKYRNLSKKLSSIGKAYPNLKVPQTSRMNAYSATLQILFLPNCRFSLLLLEFLNHIWWCSRLIGQWFPLWFLN